MATVRPSAERPDRPAAGDLGTPSALFGQRQRTRTHAQEQLVTSMGPPDQGQPPYVPSHAQVQSGTPYGAMPGLSLP